MRIRRTIFQGAAVLAALALAAPAGAQFKDNAIGSVAVDGDKVVIKATEIPGPRWFGLRVFTIPAGKMVGHNVLKTTKTSANGKSLTYNASDTSVGGKHLCISDFQGTGSPAGGMIGVDRNGVNTKDLSTAAFGPADEGIAMVGGFVGSSTGCTDGTNGNIKITMFTTGAIVQAFYGTFFGDDSASWRGDVGNLTGNHAWWNLWGNFTELGFGSTG